MSAKVKKALKNIGLTDYEVSAYITLVEKGTLTAKQVSYGAQIPYSKVYETLNSLERKGCIEVERKRPSKYFPKSPENAMKIMRGTLESEWLQNEKAIANELVPLYEKIKAKEKYDIWVIRGSLNIISKFREMTKDCMQEMLIAFPVIREELLMNFHQLLYPLTGGKVKVCLMVSRGLGEKTYKILSRIGEVRYRTKMFGGGAISDSREVLLLFSDERGQMAAIWSDHPGLAGLAKDYFEYLWKESEQSPQDKKNP